MRKTTTSVALAALILGAAGAASAQPTLGPVLTALTAQGFDSFEVDRTDGRIAVEAQRGTTKRELVYDATTGKLLKDEIGRTDDRATETRNDDRVARAGDDRRDDRGRGRGRDDGRADDHGNDRSGGRSDDHGGGRGGSGGGSGSGRGGHDDGADDHRD